MANPSALKGVSSLPIVHLSSTDPAFPPSLLTIPAPPRELFFKGSLPSPDRPAVAIVGSRKCSPYGRIQAFRFASALSKRGVQIISGMAMGIDTEAHKGALDGGTPTFAVLGCGADIVYPPSGRRLYERILEQGGGILSEYPPGTPPLSYHFPIRNRLISGLCDLLLVVEASERSGSLLTAGCAIEQGRTVYALPGSVECGLSAGTNKLLFDGAGVALNPEVLLAELGL